MGVNLELEPFEVGGMTFSRPVIIAGPCSAESEEQLLSTARELAGFGLKILRAGIWKPRTRPSNFEGVGSRGLIWLQRVKKETGMFTAVEVANVKHVYEALKYGVDILWIGARTTANPFAVQEIADTLRGIDVPVLIKNPINPDVELWIGAIERINRVGIKRIAAIHRGFSSFEKSEYRNNPQWQIPIEIKRRVPDLPLITDPSHICGNREFLYEISQKAMDLSFDGLIIESHIRPSEALSDASQQLTPADLKRLLDKLVLRNTNVENSLLLTLEELRAQIDKMDDKIIDIFEKRMEVAEEIGRYKKVQNITILQSRRWDQILTERINEGIKKGLSEEFVSRVFRAIHQESINHQEKIMSRQTEKKA